jgi:hypothetical protein
VISVALALLAAGCMGPRPVHRGPDVVKVPEGFIYDPGMQGGRNLFPARPKVLERGYTTAAIADEENSNIYIAQYDGATTEDQVAEAVRAEQERYGYAEYSALEPLTVDKRPAWGWSETQRRKDGTVAALEYRVVVSYDDATYLVEFFTSHQHFMDAARLKDVVASFEVND